MRTLLEGYRTGFLDIFALIAIVILLDVSGVKTSHPVLAAALHAFLTAALSEELCKFWMFRRRLKKIEGEHSWLDLTVYSTIVGIGFGLFESVVYVFESNPIVMLIRGISIPHGGYAAIVGYFYAKSIKENKKGYAVLGILISFLIHGLYDFSLSKEIETVTDASGFIAVNLALLELVIIIVLIRFLRRNKDNAKYTEPLVYDKII